MLSLVSGQGRGPPVVALSPALPAVVPALPALAPAELEPAAVPVELPPTDPPVAAAPLELPPVVPAVVLRLVPEVKTGAAVPHAARKTHRIGPNARMPPLYVSLREGGELGDSRLNTGTQLQPKRKLPMSKMTL